MRRFITFFIFITFLYSYSQNERQISDLENGKLLLHNQVQKLNDSIKRIDLKIAEINSKIFLDKIKDKSFKAIARKGAKLKDDYGIFANVITTFERDKEVIIIDFKDGYFKICQNSICGYMNELWIQKSNSISEFIKSKEIENSTNQKKTNSSNYISPLKNNKTKKTYKSKRYRISRTYYRGSRGGCYYINSNGNKTYVDRSLCN